MSNLLLFSFIPGLLVFLFFYWRRLREDYASELLFKLGFLLGGMQLVLTAALRLVSMGYWFWLFFGVFVVGVFVGVLRYKMRFFELLEGVLLGMFGWMFVLFVIGFVRTGEVASLIYGVMFVLFLAVFYFLDGKYKDFSWYRSGKIGFSGLTVLGLFFVVRVVFALVFTDMLSFVGIVDVLGSGLASFVVFLLLYNLAQEKR